MAAFTCVKKIGAGQQYTTLAAWEADAPVNYTTAEQSAATTFLVGTFVQNEVVTFVGSGATGKFLETDSTGPGTGTYLQYSITTGNPAASDVATGAGGATCVITSGTADFVGCIWQGQIQAVTDAFTSSSTSGTLAAAGGTVSSAAYLELTTASGASFRDQAAVQTTAMPSSTPGPSVANTGSSTGCHAIDFSGQGFSRVSNLVAKQTASVNLGALAQAINAAGESTRADNCIFEATGVNAGLIQLVTGVSAVFNNCLAVHRASSPVNMLIVASGAGFHGHMKFNNCTFVQPSDVTFGTSIILSGSNYTRIDFDGCAFYGPDKINGTNGTNTYVNCYSNATTSVPSGVTGSRTYSSTVPFILATDTGRDFRLGSGSDLLDRYAFGANTPAQDIANTTRSVSANQMTDVGCWEYVTASRGATIPWPSNAETLPALPAIKHRFG